MEQTEMTPSPPQAPQERRNELERQARILLRRVDETLRTGGARAALVHLTHVMLEIPRTPTTVTWVRNYRDMLLFWQAGYMAEVVETFQAYGFRRATDVAYAGRSQEHLKDKLLSQYATCEQALDQMSQRSRYAVTDRDIEVPSLEEDELAELEEQFEDEFADDFDEELEDEDDEDLQADLADELIEEGTPL